MIFDKARMAKLSGLMTESKHKGIKDAMADQFGGGEEEGDAWLDGEVTTEGAEEEEGSMMHEEEEDEELDEASLRKMIRSALSEAKKEMDKEKKEKDKKKSEKAKTEARKKKDDEKAKTEARKKKDDDEAKTEARKKKKDDDEELDETTVRESIRKELHSILRSKGVTLGGTGWGFKK
jgi:hypothetical protein